MMQSTLYSPHSSKESNLDLLLPLIDLLFNDLSFSTSHIQIVLFSWNITLKEHPFPLLNKYGEYLFKKLL